MKKLNALIIFLILGLFIVPSFQQVYAQNVCPTGYENLCNVMNPGIFGNIIQGGLVMAIILSVIFLIMAGTKWIMSEGDKDKIAHARRGVVASIVGLVISLVSYFIVTMIVYSLTGNSTLSLPIPKLF